jgi:hypothetical protein
VKSAAIKEHNYRMEPPVKGSLPALTGRRACRFVVYNPMIVKGHAMQVVAAAGGGRRAAPSGVARRAITGIGLHGTISSFSMACEAYDVFSKRHPGKS